ncbi:hypothetical protein MKY15_19630 [Sporosarcina sp. FSL K6-1540]
MKSKIKKVLIASALTLGLIGATFTSAPTAQAYGCSNPTPYTIPCQF